MEIETLHRYGACSTLLVSGLMYKRYTREVDRLHMDPMKSLDEFKEELKYCLDNCKPIDHVGTKHECREYAFLFASTESSISMPQKWLRELGFHETQAVFNAKNGTMVTLFQTTIEEITDILECKKQYIKKFTGKPKDVGCSL